MPKGSKPGERRGGRQRATPNKRTVLRDRILAAAAAKPTGTFREFLPILVGDQVLPDDIRIAIARKVSAEKPSKKASARANKTPATKVQAAERNVQSKSDKDVATTFARLDLLLNIVRDEAVTEAGRRKAASEVAEFLLPKATDGNEQNFQPMNSASQSIRNWPRSFVISDGKWPAWSLKKINSRRMQSPKRLASFSHVSTRFDRSSNHPTPQCTVKKRLSWTKSGSSSCVRGARRTKYSARKKK
jgi:hypothetical protein